MEGSQYVSEEGIIYHVQKMASERMRRSESVTIPEPIRTCKGNGPRLDISIYIVRQVSSQPSAGPVSRKQNYLHLFLEYIRDM